MAEVILDKKFLLVLGGDRVTLPLRPFHTEACCVNQRPLVKAAKMTAICQSALNNAACTTQQALVWEGLQWIIGT